MSLCFTSEEVRSHLESLGYDQVDKETLNQFIYDLKKLIKYEERQKKVKEKNSGVFDKTKASYQDEDDPKSLGYSSESSSAYGNSQSWDDEDSRTKFLRDRKAINTHRSPKNKRKSKSVSRIPQESGTRDERRQLEELRLKSGEMRKSRYQDEESTVSNSRNELPRLIVRTRYCEESLSEMKKGSRFANKKPTTSFIRPQKSLSDLRQPPRTDPVKLHEYYTKIWEKTRFPGDPSDKNLRWAVREWMMGEKRK